MFDTTELNVMLSALMSMDIKGSDAIYMANLQTKINTEMQKAEKKAEDKAKKAQEILSSSPKKEKIK